MIVARVRGIYRVIQTVTIRVFMTCGYIQNLGYTRTYSPFLVGFSPQCSDLILAVFGALFSNIFKLSTCMCVCVCELLMIVIRDMLN